MRDFGKGAPGAQPRETGAGNTPMEDPTQKKGRSTIPYRLCLEKERRGPELVWFLLHLSTPI